MRERQHLYGSDLVVEIMLLSPDIIYKVGHHRLISLVVYQVVLLSVDGLLLLQDNDIGDDYDHGKSSDHRNGGHGIYIGILAHP